MGIFKKKIVEKSYDRDHMKPVIRASICTGEQVAGFKDIHVKKDLAGLDRVVYSVKAAEDGVK